MEYIHVWGQNKSKYNLNVCNHNESQIGYVNLLEFSLQNILAILDWSGLETEFSRR
jgi:hypothetical protein